MKKQVYLIPNAITTFGLACGLFVILKANLLDADERLYQGLFTSLVLLLVAAFADFLDGMVARIIKAESEFGFIFDTLADAISFGVAPSVLLLKSLSLEQGSTLSFFAVVGAMIYSICGVLRLVRFNVKTAQAKGNLEEEIAQKKNFTGLPIPAAAVAAVSANLFFISCLQTKLFNFSDSTIILSLAAIWILLGFLMVSRWKFPSLKTLHFRVPSFHLVLMTVIIAIFFLYGVIHFFPLLLLGSIWGYILVGIILSIIRLIAGKKSKTLEDFEPEEEESE